MSELTLYDKWQESGLNCTFDEWQIMTIKALEKRIKELGEVLNNPMLIEETKKGGKRFYTFNAEKIDDLLKPKK